MRIGVVLVLLSLCLSLGLVHAAEDHQEVEVADPYLELHTGAGRGYPIFYVVERGERVKILKQKTDWFKVRTQAGKEGWVKRSQMEKTLTPTGEALQFEEAELGDFSRRRWEMGLLGGDLDGAQVMTLYGGYAFAATMSVELAVSRGLGDFSSSWLVTGSLVSQPFPAWRVSPFFTLGAGAMQTEPRTTLVQEQDRTDATANVGVGLRAYLTRRFIFRAEYKGYVVFTSDDDDDNEEISQWQAGFAFFF